MIFGIVLRIEKTNEKGLGI